MPLTPEDARRVGGSDLAKIVTREVNGVRVPLSRYGGPLDVYARIVGPLCEEKPNTQQARGIRLESVVLDWYAEETRRVLLRDVRWPTGDERLRASLDGMAAPAGSVRFDDLDRVVDAKTVGRDAAHLWGEPGTDEVPEDYLCQFQWYLGQTGREWCDVPVLLAGDFALYHVKADADVYGWLRQEVERFWRDHVEPRRPPPVTELRDDLRAVGRLYPRHEFADHLDFARLAPEAQVAVEECLRAHRAQAQATETLAVFEARAKLVLATAPGVAGLPPESGYARIDFANSATGSVAWKKVAEELVRVHGVPTGAVTELITKHTGEAPRPFVPRLIKGRQ